MEDNKIPNADVQAPASDSSVDVSKYESEIANLKKLLSDRNSEAAGYKKQLKEKMSEEERVKAEREEYTLGLETKIKELERGNALNSHKARFMGLGFDEETAAKQANAYLDGDVETLFGNMKVLIDSVGNNAVNNALKNQKGLSSGEPSIKKTYTREEISKMSRDEINSHWDDIKGNLK